MPPHPDAIAACVLNAFHALPAKFKPRTLADGRREWVPLAGVVLSRGRTLTAGADSGEGLSDAHHDLSTRANDTVESRLTCAALATGMKCVPQSKLAPAKGNVLHDCHAEVLAIRSFNRFLVDECADLARKGFKTEDAGEWVRWRQEQDGDPLDESAHEGPAGQPPFELREDVSIHMYCSEAPCGDASMELTMAEQADSTPWARNPQAPLADGDMLGRGHFDRLGIVRRKPARPDAPLTLSKSCSDKLAMKQCSSLLSALTSRLVWPENVYLETVVLPASQCVRSAVDRAFGAEGRMRAVAERAVEGPSDWRRGGYAFRPLEVKTTTREFEYSKRSGSGEAAVPSNLAALATPRRQEVLVNGVLQGWKQFDPKGASCASRGEMWKAAIDTASAAGRDGLAKDLRSGTYHDLKKGKALEARERVKSDVRISLKGWQRNVGDEEWELGAS